MYGQGYNGMGWRREGAWETETDRKGVRCGETRGQVSRLGQAAGLGFLLGFFARRHRPSGVRACVCVCARARVGVQCGVYVRACVRASGKKRRGKGEGMWGAADE